MRYTAYLILFISVFACKTDEVDPDAIGDIEIRIWNGSDYDFEEIFVDTNGGQNDFGNLKPNTISDYKRFLTAYRYAFVSFKINGKAYTIQPIDYVGEEQLKSGKYTYRISVDSPNSQYALLEFIEG